jgi:hypothetical protein
MVPDEQTRIAFHNALNDSDLPMVRHLVIEHPTLSQLGWNQGGAAQNLVLAAQKGNLSLFQLLVELGSPLDVVDERAGQSTPLSTAAYWGHVDLVNWLLSNGARVDGQDEAVSTPLMAAAARGHTDVINVLLAHGAEINREHLKLPQTALDFATLFSNTHKEPGEAAAILMKNGGIRPYGERHLWPLPHGKHLIQSIENTLNSCVNPLTLRELPHGAIAKTRIPKNYETQAIFTVPQNETDTTFALCLPSSWPLNNQTLLREKFRWPIDFLEELMTNQPKQGLSHPNIISSSIGGKASTYLARPRIETSKLDGIAKILWLIPIQDKHLKKVTDENLASKLANGKWSGIQITQ